jgi:Predicted phosphoribosyltransferases
MRAAIAALKQQHPERITVAVPVAAREACAEFESEVDEIICLRTPTSFHAVGLWYQRFPQLTDEEVCGLLKKARESWTSRNSGRNTHLAGSQANHAPEPR